MDQASEFQKKYPLSPRKFWKKIFPNIFTYFILSLFPGVGTGAIIFFTGYSGQSKESDLLGFLLWALLGTLIFYALFLGLRAWYIKVYIRRYYYDCSDQFITIKKGVFTPTEIHVQYPKIQDVYVDQDLLDRLMGIYDVHIASATYTSGIEAHIDGVEKDVAENIKNILLARIRGEGVSQNPQAPQVPVKAPKFESGQQINSKTYPISGRWWVSAILGAILYALLITWLFGGFVVGFIFALTHPNFQGEPALGGYVLLFLLLIFMARIIWLLLWKSNYYFEFTPDFILLKTGVISRQEIHLPYKSIQNVTNSQGLVERIFGLATVKVENAAFVGSQQKSFSLTSGSNSRSSGISLIGQPKDKAEQLNKIVNEILVNTGSTASTGL